MPVEHRWVPDGGWEIRKIKLKKLGFADYDAYQRSEHWKTRKQQALKDANFQCQECRNVLSNELKVHHQTYVRLGEELASDLRVLCRVCHSTLHFGGPTLEEQMVYRRRAEELFRLEERAKYDPEELEEYEMGHLAVPEEYVPEHVQRAMKEEYEEWLYDQWLEEMRQEWLEEMRQEWICDDEMALARR